MLVEMQQQGWQVTGLDLSPAMGRLAQARLKRLGLDGDVPLIRCRIPDIALQSAAFDSILSQFPTSFIFETETLLTLHRLLKPGGVLVILPEGHLTSRGLVSHFIHWLFYMTGQTVGRNSEQTAADAEAIFWKTLKQQFASAGFEARFEFVRLEKSEATVIVAQKI